MYHHHHHLIIIIITISSSSSSHYHLLTATVRGESSLHGDAPREAGKLPRRHQHDVVSHQTWSQVRGGRWSRATVAVPLLHLSATGEL